MYVVSIYPSQCRSSSFLYSQYISSSSLYSIMSKKTVYMLVSVYRVVLYIVLYFVCSILVLLLWLVIYVVSVVF